jgi:hypothetical protein
MQVKDFCKNMEKFQTIQVTLQDVFPDIDFVSMRKGFEYNDDEMCDYFVRQLNGMGYVANSIVFCRKGFNMMEANNEVMYDTPTYYQYSSYKVVVMGGVTFDLAMSNKIFPTSLYFKILKKKYPDIQLRWDGNSIYDNTGRLKKIGIDYLCNMNSSNNEILTLN